MNEWRVTQIPLEKMSFSDEIGFYERLKRHWKIVFDNS
jgi:hypothetical protein